jgi:hypothetical protein
MSECSGKHRLIAEEQAMARPASKLFVNKAAMFRRQEPTYSILCIANTLAEFVAFSLGVVRDRLASAEPICMNITVSWCVRGRQYNVVAFAVFDQLD